MRVLNTNRRFGENLDWNLVLINGAVKLVTDGELERINERTLNNREDVPSLFQFLRGKLFYFFQR